MFPNHAEYINLVTEKQLKKIYDKLLDRCDIFVIETYFEIFQLTRKYFLSIVKDSILL
jgi:hypothetical protein